MATIGLDYVSSTYKSPKGEDIAVKIWDTAGQERFRTITYSFYKQANGVIVTFDVTNATSFNNVKNWLESIYQHADPNIVKALVGNKIDLDDRAVSAEEAKRLADQHKMPYFETSAKLNQNVDELINYMMEQVYSKMYSAGASGENGRDTNTIVINDRKVPGGAGDDGKKKKGGCC
jgi:small GTP-binding protein